MTSFFTDIQLNIELLAELWYYRPVLVTEEIIYEKYERPEQGNSMTGLVNLMEETVLNKIDQLLPKTDYCKCDNCRMDIAAYALNRLPAQYAQSIRGKVLYQFESSKGQKDIEVTVVVSKAIEIVGKAPHKNMSYVEQGGR